MHPHQYAIGEFQVAINRLVPTVPNEIKEKAQKMHDEMYKNVDITEEEIHTALIDIGKQIYAHRQAFYEVTSEHFVQVQRKHVFKRLGVELGGKMRDHLSPGAKIHEETRKKEFEEVFTPEERATIEKAIVESRNEIDADLLALIDKNRAAYDADVKKWEENKALIEQSIEKLRAMADENEKWHDEILGKVGEFEEGWAITEKDPTLEHVQKEIENWQAVLNAE